MLTMVLKALNIIKNEFLSSKSSEMIYYRGERLILVSLQYCIFILEYIMDLDIQERRSGI